MAPIAPIFLSHGAPYLPIVEHPARDFLTRLGALFDKPQAILVVSAHWETRKPTVNSVTVNTTIHDFRGFPKALYELTYPAPGAPALARRIQRLLIDAGLEADVDTGRGLDHGAWVPLILAYPEADIPVLELSVQPQASPADHIAAGKALAPLVKDGVLIIGSGSYSHNLHEFFQTGKESDQEPTWVREFADWFNSALEEGRIEDLAHYRVRAPHAARNHPTEEHLLPLFVALGAAAKDARVRRLHRSTDRGVLRLDAFAFEPPDRA